VVAQVAKLGYADAEAQPREVIVDHADRTVRPTFRIVAGPRVLLDGVTVEPAGRTNPAWVEGLAPWKPGEVYDPEDVAELERRLLDTGVFDSVSVSLQSADKATGDGRRPVLGGAGRPGRRGRSNSAPATPPARGRAWTCAAPGTTGWAARTPPPIPCAWPSWSSGSKASWPCRTGCGPSRP